MIFNRILIQKSDAAVIEPLSVTANGTYTAPSGVDGYSPVSVNVPSGSTPVIEPLSVTANGTYTAPSGVDGYSPVSVNVPSGSTPVIEPLSVTANGTYTAPSGVDGYSPITVNVPTSGAQSITLALTNGTSYNVRVYYTGSDGTSENTIFLQGASKTLSNVMAGTYVFFNQSDTVFYEDDSRVDEVIELGSGYYIYHFDGSATLTIEEY